MDVDAMLADLTKQMDHTFLDLPDLVSDDEGPPGSQKATWSAWLSMPCVGVRSRVVRHVAVGGVAVPVAGLH